MLYLETAHYYTGQLTAWNLVEENISLWNKVMKQCTKRKKHTFWEYQHGKLFVRGRTKWSRIQKFATVVNNHYPFHQIQWSHFRCELTSIDNTREVRPWLGPPHSHRIWLLTYWLSRRLFWNHKWFPNTLTLLHHSSFEIVQFLWRQKSNATYTTKIQISLHWKTKVRLRFILSIWIWTTRFPSTIFIALFEFLSLPKVKSYTITSQWHAINH